MAMINHIRQKIMELKEKVQSNVVAISENQSAIKLMLRHSRTNEYAGQYDVFYSNNKELLNQNNDLINVQRTLVNFIEKYKDTAILKPDMDVVDIFSVTDLQEVFDLTIKGIVCFNEKHPYYEDLGFINKLIVYYESIEYKDRSIELQNHKYKIAS